MARISFQALQNPMAHVLDLGSSFQNLRVRVKIELPN